MACSREFGESIGVLAFFLKSREKAYLVPALFFTASASESRFRAIASLGAHDERRVVPETCGVTHFDCWLSETGGLSGYNVVAASEGNFDVAERIFDRVRKPRFLAGCASHGPPTLSLLPFHTLPTSRLRLPFCARETSPDDNHGPPFLLQDLQGPP